jgi:hypothetical protein
MVVVDFHGYRLLAASLLPLGKHTLVYGSEDGGRTIRADHPEANNKMQLLGKSLNLQGENVRSGVGRTVFLSVSCDVEAHLGTDNRFYLVDLARLWPPTPPRPGVRGDFLVRQFRPEFVRKYPVPLCSDSFSGFPLQNKEQHNEEIRQAMTKLMEEMIAFAKNWTPTGVCGSQERSCHHIHCFEYALNCLFFHFHQMTLRRIH